MRAEVRRKKRDRGKGKRERKELEREEGRREREEGETGRRERKEGKKERKEVEREMKKAEEQSSADNSRGEEKKDLEELRWQVVGIGKTSDEMVKEIKTKTVGEVAL